MKEDIEERIKKIKGRINIANAEKVIADDDDEPYPWYFSDGKLTCLKSELLFLEYLKENL